MLGILLYLGILLFLAGSAVAVAGGKAARRASISMFIAGSSCFVALSVSVAASGGTFTPPSYDLAPGLSLAMSIDWLSALFMALVAVVSITALVYSFEYIEAHEGGRRKDFLCALTGAFILSMLMVPASASLFAFLFFWELMSLSSFLLVMFEREKGETSRAGLFYFAMTQLSTVFLFLGFLALGQATGSSAIMPGTGALLDPAAASGIFTALFIGFGIKAGVIPFHKWLPYAHSASPSNISALMSGVMIKIAIYGMVRFFLYVLSPQLSWGLAILAAGSVSALLGVIYALKEHDIKRLLAYHSIENIGIILISIGLSVIFAAYAMPEVATIALAGALFHTVNHALFKSLLFMAAGSVINATHTRNMEEMGGLIKRMPRTAALFLIGAVAISALPPLNGFVSELMIFSAFMQAHLLQDLPMTMALVASMAALALTSALAAACFVKAFGITFLGLPRSEKAKGAKEAGLSMVAGPAIAAALCISLGIFSYQIFSLLGMDALKAGIPDMLPIGVVLLFTCGLTWAAMKLSSNGACRTYGTWDCGSRLNERTQYTASGFSQPITRIFQPIYRSRVVREVTFFDKYGSIVKGGHGEIRLMRFFEEVLYIPVARAVDRIAYRVARLQNGDIDAYLAYAFLAVLAVLVFIGGATI